MRKGKVTAASALELALDVLDNAETMASDLGAKRCVELGKARDLISTMSGIGPMDWSVADAERFLDMADLLRVTFPVKELQRIAAAVQWFDGDVHELTTLICKTIQAMEKETLAPRKSYGKKIMPSKAGHGKCKKRYGTHR